MASPAEQALGLSRRQQRFNVRLVWLGEQFERGFDMTMRARVRLAAQLLRDKVAINLSVPVRKYRSPRTGRTVVDPTSRSRSGEFPRADTTRLMKDIYYEMQNTAGGHRAIVGTTLDYGLLLETVMNRSFLVRTLNEMQPYIRGILTRGRGGGASARFPET